MSANATRDRQCELTNVDGGISAPGGFRSGAVHCGIKPSGDLDLLVLAADRPVSVAALFTTNLTVAAPVLVSRQHLAANGGSARAIVVNSGCANACTGNVGLDHAKRMTEETAAALGCSPDHILVASTGVIGVALDMTRITAGIRGAVAALVPAAGHDAARAIMTTDLSPKERAVAVHTGSGTFTVGGMAKGAGMIEPKMATMLGFLTTDASISPGLLQRALREVANDTFNAITVDGECSTNDSLFAMASGASNVNIDEALYPALVAGLRAVAHDLALAIIRGGEGATKLVAVRVRDAASVAEARTVARTIANSLLVKTALHGADPNWGRIIAAAGRSGVQFDVSKSEVRVGGILLFEQGRPHDDLSQQAEQHLQQPEVDLEVSLGSGGGAEATIWTCDLSPEYVRINGEYRT